MRRIFIATFIAFSACSALVFARQDAVNQSNGKHLADSRFEYANQANLLQSAVLPESDTQLLTDAAEWLMTQQNNDGAYPWTVGESNITTEAQGAIARGMILAYDVIGDSRYLDSAIETGDFLVTSYPRSFSDGDPDIFMMDVLFLEELTFVTGDAQYTNFIETNFWTKLGSSTYGENNDLDATTFAEDVPEFAQFAHWKALEPWYRTHPALTAHFTEKTAMRDVFMASVLDKLEETQSDDIDGDLSGVAGAIWASSITGIDLDPQTGRWASSNSTQDLVNVLLSYQRSGGDWPYDTGWRAALHVGDVSVTTWACIALKAFDAATYSTEIGDGLDFIRSLQQSNGQILTNPGYPVDATAGIEVHAEAMISIGSDDGLVLTQESNARVALKVLLEGPTDAVLGEMSTAINGQIDLTSPYAEDARTVSSIPSDVVDWVLVQLRETSSGAAVASKSAFLHRDGRIVADDGATNEIVLDTAAGDYFVVVKHRNHLAIMSTNLLTLADDQSTLYDFTSSQAQAFGGNPMNEISTGVFAMISGDGNSDGQVDGADHTAVWRAQNGTPWSYAKPGDFNLDGGIDALDLNQKWRINNGRATQVP